MPSGVFAAGYFSPFAHRPSTLALWASDALIDLHWGSWGGPIATARGREQPTRMDATPLDPPRSSYQILPCAEDGVFTPRFATASSAVDG